jgi:hypothetical protein
MKHGPETAGSKHARGQGGSRMTKPGEMVHVDFTALPALPNHKARWLFAAIDDFCHEAVTWLTTESSGVADEFTVVDSFPYQIEAITADDSFAVSEQALARFGIKPHRYQRYEPRPFWTEQFLHVVQEHFMHGISNMSAGTLIEALNRVVWSYNNERPQLSLEGMTPVEFRRRFFDQTEPNLVQAGKKDKMLFAPRAKLYLLIPIENESLSGYISRLADLHAISIRKPRKL